MALTYEEAKNRIEAGMAILKKVGLQSAGFVAPAWLLNRDGTRKTKGQEGLPPQGRPLPDDAHEIEDLQAENARLGNEIAALRSDPRAIERLAREELGLARPGETVFLVGEGGSALP